VETKEIIYFDEPGPSNTDDILELAKSRIEALGIKTVVIASQAGVTVRRFLALADGLPVNIVAVTNPKGPGLNVTVLYEKYKNSKDIKENYMRQGITHFQCSISAEDREIFERSNVRVIEQKDYLNIGDPWGLNDEEKLSERDLDWKATRAKLRPFIPTHIRPLDIEAGADLSVLNIISKGFRVLVGATVVAVDRGLVPEGETVLSIAGTGFAGGGADTAAILRASGKVRGCLVKEILGFPRLK
jgi:hypothetical protein